MVVWYIEKDGEFVGVIARDLPSYTDMLREAAEYVECMVWVHSRLSWYSIPSNSSSLIIWEKGTPPESVLMAEMIGE